MKDYDKNRESPYNHYWDVNNLYDWAMSQKIPVLENTSQLNEDFIKNHDKESDEGFYFKLMFDILKNYMNFIMIYHFYQNEWKLKKLEKLVANLHDITEYIIHIRNLKQVLNDEVVIKKVHKVIKFNQNAWLKPYIDMNENLIRKSKKWF